MRIDIDNKEFQDAYRIIRSTNQSLFLTGRAGTGKSTFLKYICQNIQKKHVVLAPTGIAAINAEGVTIHSFFKMPFRPTLPDDPDLSLVDGRIHQFLKYKKQHRKLLQEVELVIIDEISMVRADMIDFIDRVLRVYSHNMRQPFGGKQLLLVGDIYQLEPVVPSDTKEILKNFYPNPFFFSAKAFQELGLISIELQKVYRQTDPSFIELLDQIRVNSASYEQIKQINQRHQPLFAPHDDQMYITLATRRDQVDYINEAKIKEIAQESHCFVGQVEGEFPEGSLPTLKELTLKAQAQIMFIKNDPNRRFVNGTLGVVSHISEDSITILLENGSEIDIERAVWRNVRYKYDEKNKKITEEELGTFSQYPIRLAWAITVHKSQGLTFPRVIIDFSGGAFAGGQTYVALSRCCSLEGIVLRKPISRTDVFVRPEIVHFSKSYNDALQIEKSLKQAEADHLYREATQAFDTRDFNSFIDQFFLAIHARYDIEKPLIKRYIRRKLGVITLLETEKKQLKKQLEDKRKLTAKFAKEYLEMGNDCITKAHDWQAALANYNKALDMDPKLVDGWVRKGVTLYNLGAYHHAEKSLDKAVKLSPRLFKARYNRGKNRVALLEYDSAISDLLIASSLKADHINCHRLLASCFDLTGNPEQAEIHRTIADLLDGIDQE